MHLAYSPMVPKYKDVPNRLAIGENEPSGTDWFGDDRESLNDLAKYYNNAHLSDVNLVVGEEIFPAHRLILAKSSEVFDRMLSQRWNGEKKDLELVEEPMCQKEFSSFLRFLYCNHVVLNQDNCLPLLVLSDKYNVTTLKKVCLDFAQSQIIPVIETKELFSVWFSYATKAYHPSLIRTCMQSIALDFDTLLSDEWEKNWQQLDRDQMIEILKCNNLRLSNEFKLWEAFLKWIQAPNHPERRGNTSSPLLTLVLPLIRFPHMSPDELSQVERSSIAELHPKLFLPSLMLAYKFQALPIASRTYCKEFHGKQFLLRNYDDIRWYKRLTVNKLLVLQDNVDHSLMFLTKSSTYPAGEWKWTVRLCGSSYDSAHHDVLRIKLIAEEIDQPRAVEYLLQLADERKIIRSYHGKKAFSKARNQIELEIEKKFELGELLNDESSLLNNGDVVFHVVIKPIE